MIKIYNESSLIKYLYKEASAEEGIAVKEVLKRSKRIRNEFRQLQQLRDDLFAIKITPKSSSVNNILSKSSNKNWVVL
jgi:hypothetical protein